MGFVRRLLLAGTVSVLCLLTARGLAQDGASLPNDRAQKASRPQPHSEQAYSLPPEKLAEAVALDRIRIALEIAGSVWSLLVLWWLVGSGTAARLEGWGRRRMKQRWVQGLVFFGTVIAILSLASLPLDAFAHAASLRYHISVQGWAQWLVDQGKGLGVSLVIGVPVALFFNWIVRVAPRQYWIWIWVLSIPLILISVFLAPLVLDPIFNKFAPLESTHPALVQKLEEVVARTGVKVPPSRMFLMRASEKSNGINAYVTGIGGSKRFVMWDTTMDRMPDDEIMFVFGHESGHYVLHHIPKTLAMMIVGLLFAFWACARVAEWLVRRFGERWGVHSLSERAGFVVLFFAFSVANFIGMPVGNTVSRHFEHEADVYGQEAIHGLVPDARGTTVSAFNHMGEAWLDNPHPNGFVEFWLYDHPSVQNRAEFAEHYDPWANGGDGEFFSK